MNLRESIKNELTQMLAVGVCTLAALWILYKNLAALTIVTTKNLKLKTLRQATIFNMVVIGIICGCYFWIFAKEKIPAYYDQNKVTAYSDGVFRMNLVGTSIKNSNWKYILQVGRIWSIEKVKIIV